MPKLGLQKIPAKKVPKIPPTPCTGNTSKESSICSVFLINCVIKKQITPAIKPITNAPAGPTTPAAPVIVPKPAITPVTIPKPDGLPNLIHSQAIQANAPADAAICVTNNAIPALPLAAKAEPPLKPYQPTHNIPAPIIVMVKL